MCLSLTHSLFWEIYKIKNSVGMLRRTSNNMGTSDTQQQNYNFRESKIDFNCFLSI